MKITEARRKNSLSSNRRGYGIVETLIVIVIISVLIVVVMGRYEDILWEARKVALQSELGNLRQAINLFKITRGRYPYTLNELITTNVVFYHADPEQKIFKGKYLEKYSIDRDQNIIDPFDLPYVYNPVNGTVRSQKKGFETW